MKIVTISHEVLFGTQNVKLECTLIGKVIYKIVKC